MSNHPLLTALVGMAMLGGCNLVFTPGQAQPDAGGDGGNTVDGKVDDPNGSDFDGDTILDSVDPCPISSNNTADSDNDGLPNDCDLAFGVARPATQCVLLFRGFPQGSAITGERRFPVVSNARSLQLGGKVTALSANPRIQLRLVQGLSWDGFGAMRSGSGNVNALSGALVSGGDATERTITTTNAHGATDGYNWAPGEFALSVDLRSTVFQSAYFMYGQATLEGNQRREFIPNGEPSWVPPVNSRGAVDLRNAVTPAVFVENASFEFSYLLVTGDCP